MIPIPSLTTEQMVEVDRLMVEHYQILLIQMMENAGRNLALLGKHLLDNDLLDRPVVVLAGRGNNGGGGLVAARHLMNWGAWVQVLLTHQPEQFRGIPAHQLSVLQRMGVSISWAEDGWELPPADLVVDALIGYGLDGNPRGTVADLIRLANSSMAPILSLDAPSGLDTNEGRLFNPHMRATATMTLALPKKGLVAADVQDAVGQLFLADISVPPDLYHSLDLDVPPIFGAEPLLSLIVENGAAFLQNT